MPDYLKPGWYQIPAKAIPSGFRAVRIRDVANIYAGGKLGLTKERDYRGTGFAAFSAAGQDGYVEICEYSNSSGVVLSAIGAQCGKCFIALGNWTTLANTQTILPKAGQADARFIWYRVNRDDYWPRSGSAQPFIKPSDIGKCWLLLPDLPEQKLIAEILDTLDEAIRKTEQVIDKLKQMKQGLLHDLLTRGLDDNGELRNPDRHPDQFHMTPLGRLPKGWTVSSLGEQLTLQRGFDITVAQQRTGPFPVVSSSGITSYHAKSMVDGPAVVIGRKGKLGDAYYIPGPCWPHDTSLWVKDFHGNDARFAAIFLKFLRLERFDAATSVPTLNRNFVHPLRIAIPKPFEQREIVLRMECIEAREIQEVYELRKLQLIKQGLMDDLLTGRVRVTNLIEQAA